MDIKIIKQEKNEMDVELNSLTVAELLRSYLNKEGADMAVWKRDHPSKNPVLHIEGDNPKRLIQKAIASIEKELEKLQEDFKKAK
jgi:DNA-directed RNA polymerase subunit L